MRGCLLRRFTVNAGARGDRSHVRYIESNSGTDAVRRADVSKELSLRAGIHVSGATADRWDLYAFVR
jgi:hypothetical protein